MSKKDRQRKGSQSPGFAASATASSSKEDISRRGWRVIAGGVALLAIGFGILSFSDSMGRNWASHLAPFVILGAYAVIGIGIFLPESSPPN